MLKPFQKLQFSERDSPTLRADLLNKLGGALSSIFLQILGVIGEATAVPLPASSVVSETGAGQTTVVGTAVTYARGDHSHGTPGHVGTATLDFGATPAETASVAVTGQTWVTAASRLRAFFMVESTVDNGTDEHEEASAMCPLVIGSLVAGAGFTIFANPLGAMGLGTFSVRWEAYP